MYEDFDQRVGHLDPRNRDSNRSDWKDYDVETEVKEEGSQRGSEVNLQREKIFRG